MDNNKINYRIPESKKDILLEDWIEFVKLKSEEEIDPEFLRLRMFEIFCGVPMEHATKLRQTEIDEMDFHLTKVFEEKSELVKKFEFEGVEYGFINDFDKDVTHGELIDLENYYKEKEFDKVLSILYRPITNESDGLYRIEPYESSHTKFLKLSFDLLDGALSFFLHLYQKLLNQTLLFIQKTFKKSKMKNMDYQEKLNSLLNGVDILKSYGYW